MQIAVITVQREPMYLIDTLRSLKASMPQGDPPPVWVFIGSPKTLDICLALDKAELEIPSGYTDTLPYEIWALIEKLPPHLRAVGNFVNALQSGDDDLMLFEDDVKIKPGWLDAIKMEDVVWGDNADDFDPEHCFVSLYSHRDLRGCAGHTTAALLRWPIQNFYGTLGLFVPKAHRKPLAEAALIHLQPDDPRPVEQRWPFDEIVKIYINDHRECSLAITIPSYVDHVGDVSIINPTHGPRRAPMF